MTGKTGTGKTVFERWWLQHWEVARWPIVVIDIKRKFCQRYAREPQDARLSAPFDITDTGLLVPGCPVMIYHPSIPGWSDAKLNRLFLQILAHGHIVLALDEVAGVADESHCPLGLMLIWTQGRQSHIPALACFQKPVKIPIDLMEQCEWWAVFRVNNPDYRKRIVDMTGFAEMIQRPPRYYYWLAFEQWETPVLMAPVPWSEEKVPSGPEVTRASSSRLLGQAGSGGGQGRGTTQKAAPGKR